MVNISIAWNTRLSPGVRHVDAEHCLADVGRCTEQLAQQHLLLALQPPDLGFDDAETFTDACGPSWKLLQFGRTRKAAEQGRLKGPRIGA